MISKEDDTIGIPVTTPATAMKKRPQVKFFDAEAERAEPTPLVASNESQQAKEAEAATVAVVEGSASSSKITNNNNEEATARRSSAKVEQAQQEATEEQAQQQPQLVRRMTHMGRFTILTEDKTNLSIPTAMIVIEKPIVANDNEAADAYETFIKKTIPELVQQRIVNKHYRFRCRPSHDYNYFVQIPTRAEDHIIYQSLHHGIHQKDDSENGQENKFDEEEEEVEEDEELLLRKRISEWTNRPLDMQHALWQLVIFDDYSKGIVLYLRVHHSVGDGTSLGYVLMNLCDEPPALEEASSSKDKTTLKKNSQVGCLGSCFKFAKSLFTTVLFVLWFAIGSIRVMYKWLLESLKRDPHTWLKPQTGVSLSERKQVAWNSTFCAVEELSAIGKKHRATINDMMLNIVAGAIDRYSRAIATGQQEQVTKQHYCIRIGIPVNVRTSMHQMKILGNMFGFMIGKLPLGIANAKDRLKFITSDMAYNKSIPEALLGNKMSFLGRFVPTSTVKSMFTKLSEYLSLVMTNVRGSPTELTIGKQRMTEIVGFVPPPTNVGFGICVMSYKNYIAVSVEADENVIADPSLFIDEMMLELEHQRNTL